MFCYGVVISYLSLDDVIREFARVTKPGGLLYVCLNGLGWSMYLRDERGRENDKYVEMGVQGIYNSVCRQHLEGVRSGLVALASGLVTDRELASTTLDALREYKSLRARSGSGVPLQHVRNVVAEVGRTMVGGVQNPVPSAIDLIEHECGEAYARLLADDMVAIAEGAEDTFSHDRASRGYEPGEVERTCRNRRFRSFQWGAEGALCVDDTQPHPGTLFDGWYRGHHQVWEFTARRTNAPGDTAPASQPVAASLASASVRDERPSGWLLKDDHWGRRPREDRAQIAPYPYPFRAAVAISNDTDGMDLDALDTLHDFVNGTRPTAYGDGLGLEMGDSFWVWSPRGHLSLFHAMPFDRRARRAPEAKRIAQLGEAGIMDTLHGFGAWTDEWAIGRECMQRGLAEIQRIGLKPTVYVNHGGRRELHGGGGYHMRHNIAGPWAYYQGGDDPESPSYCLDLLTDAGFRFYWTDVFYENEKFGDYWRFRNQHKLDRAAGAYDFGRFMRRRDPTDHSIIDSAFPDASEEELIELRHKLFNQTIVPIEARDGRAIHFFKRFRGPYAPNSGNFTLQINALRLDELERNEGAVVIYQHFGIWQPIGSPKDHPAARRAGHDVLDPHGVAAFTELAERQEAGRVFVTTTGRLLEYFRIRDNLVFQTLERDSVHVIRIKRVHCPVEGESRLDAAMLQGLSFRVPSAWRDTVVEVDGLRGVPAFARKPDPSIVGFDRISFAWPRLEYPRSKSGPRREARKI